MVTVPATIIRSDCRGEARKTPAPNRSRSIRDDTVTIISMAQHAKPKVMGHKDESRAQLKIRSTVVKRTNPSPVFGAFVIKNLRRELSPTISLIPNYSLVCSALKSGGNSSFGSSLSILWHTRKIKPLHDYIH